MKNSRMRRKNGFTLVELLAVIVVLAIILVIAIPKVMTIIEDAKMGTLESTAKMIASGAEKQLIQNTVLGKEKEVTCESVAKLNNTDYTNCSIEFVNGTAFVTIEGSGKFDGLWVCDGTKTTATASKDGCGVEFVNAVTYLEDKSYSYYYEYPNAGFLSTYSEYDSYCGENDCEEHYVGESVSDNYIYYNCESKDSNGIDYLKLGYDYENSCEVWTIRGIYDVEDGYGNTQKRINLLNWDSTFEASWDSSSVNINDGVGINQWGPSGDYEGADLMRLLNGYYIGKEGTTCTYCNGLGQETCGNICDTESLKSENMKPLTFLAKEMIDVAKWDTYAYRYYNYSNYLYFQTRGIKTQYTGKSGCEEGNTKCTDNVERTTSWVGLVGLSYAHADSLDYTHFINTYYVNENEYVPKYVNPSVYLKPETYIVCGDGTENLPYILSLQSKVNPSVCPVYVPSEPEPEPDNTASSTSTATTDETSTSTATTEESISTATE